MGEKEKEREPVSEQASIPWFTPVVTTRTKPGPGQTQDPGALCPSSVLS